MLKLLSLHYAIGLTFGNTPNWDFDVLGSIENEEECLTAKNESESFINQITSTKIQA